MNVLSFGEVLWDIIEGEEYLGGAPFNLASHLAQMGSVSAMVSAVGDDERGRKAVKEAKKNGVDTRFIEVDEGLSTGTIQVEVDENGSPSYQVEENSAWDRIVLSAEQLDALAATEWDVCTFGTLAQRTENNRGMLRKIIETANPVERFFDVNLRLNFYDAEVIKDSLELATMLKLNDEEVPIVSRLLYGEEFEGRAFAEKMEKDWNIHTSCITRGKNGASVYRGGDHFHIPVVKVSVADTVGAGDSFSAAFLFGYFITGDVKKAGNLASLVSSYTASKKGAIPAYDEPVSKAIERVRREAEEDSEGESK